MVIQELSIEQTDPFSELDREIVRYWQNVYLWQAVCLWCRISTESALVEEYFLGKLISRDYSHEFYRRLAIVRSRMDTDKRLKPAKVNHTEVTTRDPIVFHFVAPGVEMDQKPAFGGDLTETRYEDDSLNCVFDLRKFVEWAGTIDIKPNGFDLLLPVVQRQSPKALRPNQRAKIEVQKLARKIWATKPDITKRQMARIPEITHIAENIVSVNTLNNWISEVSKEFGIKSKRGLQKNHA